MIKKEFKKYLVSKGYSSITPNGHPSTVYDYIKRIDKVCKWENSTWNSLASSISAIVKEYDIGGAKETLGLQSHRAVINALKRFEEYCATR